MGDSDRHKQAVERFNKSLAIDADNEDVQLAVAALNAFLVEYNGSDLKPNA